MNIEEDKIAMRQRIEANRSSLAIEERLEKQHIINRKLIQCVHTSNLRSVMAYMPFRSEVDITPFIEWCWDAKVKLLCPRMIRETKSMMIHEVTSYTDLHINSIGIREPLPHIHTEPHIHYISMVIVPGIAFDQQFGRLGYGGGYYDRFFQFFQQRGYTVPYKVSIAFDVQVVKQVPMAPHDIRIDRLITESL